MPAEATRTLLVVDDNPATLYATSRVLRHAGFTVLEASTGNRAVEIATHAPIDLVVLDIDLPDINGYEVCRLIRAIPSTSRIRVVYLSASFVEYTHKVRAFEAGADGFLTHPVEPAVLNASVGALLRTRAIEIELENLLDRERMAREDAERANRAKDDFLATLSHELRSPLTAIVGWAEVARIKAADQPEIQHALTVITRNARLQARLIADLLDVSRFTAGKDLEMDLEPVSLADIIRGSVESGTRAAEERNIRFETHIDPSIGPVNGDAGRLNQAVSNLLSNAIKFSEPGGVVRVDLSRQGDMAEISVTDSGRGIGSEVLERIFDRFWQEDTTLRRSHGGLGLGLFIVSHIAMRHGGRAEAHSDGEGQGARFTIRLPLDPSVALQPPEAMDSPEAPGQDLDLTGMRVLLVDDDPDAREWVRHVVAAAGAETKAVSNVEAAVEAVTLFGPDVIVSDLAMPGRTGFDLVSALRKAGLTGATLPVIALSAHAGLEYERRALEADFQFFVAKPPEPQALVRLIRKATR